MPVTKPPPCTTTFRNEYGVPSLGVGGSATPGAGSLISGRSRVRRFALRRVATPEP
ncbi:MAG: hypothetical protein QM756_22815 [Polyangiaceae bacterium]